MRASVGEVTGRRMGLDNLREKHLNLDGCAKSLRPTEKKAALKEGNFGLRKKSGRASGRVPVG